MLRIGIDQDGVVANLHDEWLRRYNYDYNDCLKTEDITYWNWHDLTVKDCREKIYTYLDDPEIFASLSVIEGSQEVIQKLSNKYEIFFITSPFNPNNVVPKHNWLKKHFDFIPEDNYVFTRNKSIAHTDWLIDDKAANFKGFKGVGLLFDAAHNQDEKDYFRVKNWREVEQYFEWT
jgi:5'-nucleotidase